MKFDDYLPCQAYSNQAKHTKHTEFASFFDEKSQRYFFALVSASGEVLLKSEGYPQEKTRENGIESVLKNKDIRDRYTVKAEGKEFFVSLRAGNRQEIARSCGFATEAAATEFIGKLFGEIPAAPAKKAAVAKPAAPKVEAAKVEAPKPAAAKATPAKVEKVKPAAAKETPAVKVVVETPVHTKEEVAKPAAKPAAAKVEKAFLSSEQYLGRPTLSDEFGQTGYAVFQGPDKKHYLSVYNPDGSIFLRSEGFANQKAVDAALTSVKNNIINPEQYHVKEASAGFAVVLMDEKSNEIASSLEFDSFTAAFVTTPKGRTRTEGVVLY